MTEWKITTDTHAVHSEQAQCWGSFCLRVDGVPIHQQCPLKLVHFDGRCPANIIHEHALHCFDSQLGPAVGMWIANRCDPVPYSPFPQTLLCLACLELCPPPPPSDVGSSGIPNVKHVSRRCLTRPSAPDSDLNTMGQSE